MNYRDKYLTQKRQEKARKAGRENDANGLPMPIPEEIAEAQAFRSWLCNPCQETQEAQREAINALSRVCWHPSLARCPKCYLRIGGRLDCPLCGEIKGFL